MDTMEIILMSAFVGLITFLKIMNDHRDSKIKGLEIEVDILKDRDRINDKFTDNLYDSAIDCTNKINDLKKEIENLKQAMKTVIPPNDYRTIYCDGSTCTNPFKDCVNCPNQFSSGGTVTTTFVNRQKDEQIQ